MCSWFLVGGRCACMQNVSTPLSEYFYSSAEFLLKWSVTGVLMVFHNVLDVIIMCREARLSSAFIFA